MTTIALDNRGGNTQLAQWVPPSDVATCPRCGITRHARADRRNRVCRDCRMVEREAQRQQPEPLAGGRMVRVGMVWRFVPTEPVKPERMSAEDLAWCERAAEIGRRLQTERANRRGYWQRHKRKAG